MVLISSATNVEQRTSEVKLLRNDHKIADAVEMMSILQTSECIKRYNKISHELLSELLVAIATGGEVIGSNNRGSDVCSQSYGLIEVKSRILGTDGPRPRVSLKKANIDKADWFAAVRWDSDFQLHDAIMLPKSSAVRLYETKKQSSGSAHISWIDWISDPEAVSIKEQCLGALAT